MTSAKRTRSIFYILFSIGLTVFVLGYLFTHVTWNDVAGMIMNLNLSLLALFVLLSLSMQAVRTLRYKIILESSGHTVGFARLFLAVMVRGLCVDLLPARAGELAYIYILRARLGVDLGAATASFALAFAFDMAALSPLILLAIVMVGSTAQLSPALLAGLSILLLALSAILIYMLPAALRFAFCACRRMPWMGTRLRTWLTRLIASTHRHVALAQSRGFYKKVFAYSVAVRLLKYAGLYVLLLAMLNPQGYNLADLPVPKVFLGLVAAEMAASLPISGIAGFGAYQGVWTLVFVLLGFPAEMARVTSLSHHLFSQVYAYSLGIAALLMLLALRPAPSQRQHQVRSARHKKP